MNILLKLLVLTTITTISSSAPASDVDVDRRQAKSLSYFDYLQPDDDLYNKFEIDNDDDYVSLGLEENDLSRTIPSRKISSRPFNSPVYYIRLPPQPYIFVPGVGYISQPPPSPMTQLLNVPVSFVSNGKPEAIYQWGSALNGFPTVAPPPPPPVVRPKPQPKPKPTDSTIQKVPGRFTFNGKPNDIFVLRDTYNSLYSDALQNFYP